MTPAPRCDVRGEGETVLFLHGLGGAAKAWRPQLERFSDGWRAAAWDMPGYGGSAPLGRMTFAALADALLALLDDRGWEKVHLVGHSMGGMVAQEFAASRQDRLLSLVLFATSPAFGRSDGAFQKKFVADRLAPLDAGGSMADIADAMAGAMMPDGADAAGRALARECMAEVPEDAYRAAVACIVDFDRRADLARVRVPALVLAGETDANAPPAMMEKMASRIPGARYACLPGLGHLANLEAPAAFDAALGGFLDGVRARRDS